MTKTGFEEWGTNIGIAYFNGVYANQRFKKAADGAVDMCDSRTLFGKPPATVETMGFDVIAEEDGWVYIFNPNVESIIKDVMED